MPESFAAAWIARNVPTKSRKPFIRLFSPGAGRFTVSARSQTTRTVRETEAEAVAFVVCEAVGLYTNTASADYIRLYSGDKATLAESLYFIQSTAAAILTAIIA